MNLNKLKGKIVEKNISRKSIAEALNITVQALGKKLNGKTGWSTDDANIVSDLLGLSDEEKIDIFLP